jgi:hypothetical protein
MKIISALAFITTLFVSSIAHSDEPMKDRGCITGTTSNDHIRIQSSGLQTITPGHSSFITPVFFPKGRTTIAVVGGLEPIVGPMGCFIVRIVPTSSDNFGTGGDAVAGEFNKNVCLFHIDVKEPSVFAIMVENDDKSEHDYDVLTFRQDSTCK